jgi:peptidyl-tRNA hydrolase, PTH1 family
MHLIVGLGNPGTNYARHRHNIGFMALDRIASRHGLGPWRNKFSGQFSDGVIGGARVGLLKPETHMNLSGDSVGTAVKFFKLTPDGVSVIYDEIDLAPGKIKIKTGGGTGGHNGIRSVAAHIGSEFCRVRLGIGHPGHKDLVHRHVLGDFAKSDLVWLEPLLDALAENAGLLAENDTANLMNRVSLVTGKTLEKDKAKSGDGPASPKKTGRGNTSPGGTKKPATDPAKPAEGPEKPASGPMAAILGKLFGRQEN